jgi:hypothetical protein
MHPDTSIPQVDINGVKIDGAASLNASQKSPYLSIKQQLDQKQKDSQSSRIHILYKGQLQKDVEKERDLTIYQLDKVRFTTERSINAIAELKLQNDELKSKLRRYAALIKEQHNIYKARATQEQNIDETHEKSVTRKIGYTEFGDISDSLELNSALNKSIEHSNFISRANLDVNMSDQAIKKQDYAAENFAVDQRSDLSSAHVDYKLSASMNL